MVEEYKFQELQVYQVALGYVDAVYALSRLQPERERYNLSSQVESEYTKMGEEMVAYGKQSKT